MAPLADRAPMGTRQESVRIAAPPAAVWAVLEDFGGIAAWHPGLSASRLLGTQATGVGARRHCDIQGGGWVKERVVAWEAGRGYTWEVEETDMPMARARNSFAVQAEGQGSVATFRLEYTMKGGPLGKLMEVLVANRMMAKAARETLAGLKERAERGAGTRAAAPAATRS